MERLIAAQQASAPASPFTYWLPPAPPPQAAEDGGGGQGGAGFDVESTQPRVVEVRSAGLGCGRSPWLSEACMSRWHPGQCGTPRLPRSHPSPRPASHRHRVLHAQPPDFYVHNLPPAPPGLEWWAYRAEVPLLPSPAEVLGPNYTR